MSKNLQTNVMNLALAGLLAGSVVACGGGETAEAPDDEGEETHAVAEEDGEEADADEADADEGDQEAHAAAAHECRGKNECKGKGGCAVEGQNECKGKNPCKGKGGCSTAKMDADDDADGEEPEAEDENADG